MPLLNHATRLEVAGGVTHKIQANVSFYAQAGYEFAVAPVNTQHDEVKGDIGLRLRYSR